MLNTLKKFNFITVKSFVLIVFFKLTSQLAKPFEQFGVAGFTSALMEYLSKRYVFEHICICVSRNNPKYSEKQFLVSK